MQVAELLSSQYGLIGQITRLSGENHNYLIETAEGSLYVLKIASNEFPKDMLEYEYLVSEYLSNLDLGFDLPRIIPTCTGQANAILYWGDENQLFARLLEYLPGIAWSQVDDHTPEQCYSLGRMLAELDLALTKFDHPAAHRSHRWDLTAVSQHRNKICLVDDPDQRRVLEWMFQLYSAWAIPKLAKLPYSIIHGDVNDENLLLIDGRISGLLDFGDSSFNPTICELAITLAYVMLDQAEPLQIGSLVVDGYNSIRPLSMDELTVLYPLICSRLCTTVTVAAERRLIAPDHPDWFITEDRAWRLLELLFSISPTQAANQLTSLIFKEPIIDPGKPPEELLKKREKYVSRSLSIAYRKPLKIVRGEGQYLFDHLGRPYLDLVNNVCHVGHCHPRVVAAGQVQMAQLNTNTRYLYDGLTDYAERLTATLPEPLSFCFFVNSGSEANELALRLAMQHTGRDDFLVVEGAYHGSTPRLIEISPYKFMGQGGSGRPKSWVHVVPMPDGYRGRYRGNDRSTGVAYGEEVGRIINESNLNVAGFISESLLSCGGQIIPPQGYFETAFQHVRAAGGLCILDEVQVGFGRIGTHFWAFELHGVIPDIVVMGKPIGNGHPMAAVVTTKEIAESFASGMEYFSTFGGNPVSCTIGMAVLDVIRDENLQQHALQVGSRLLGGLRNLMEKHSIIGDVRGNGLFIGVELVQDRVSLQPATELANELINRMQARGILLSTDGPFHNVLKIKPPLVLTFDDVDMFVRVLDDELSLLTG